MVRKNIPILFDKILEFLLCAMIFVLPFSKSMVEIFFSLLLGLWITKRIIIARNSVGIFRNIFRFPRMQLNLAIGVFVLFGFLSMLFSTSYPLSLEGFFFKLLELVMIYFMVASIVKDRRSLNKVLLTILASIILITIDAIFQYVKGVDFLRGYYLYGTPLWDVSQRGFRVQASFGNPNTFSGWLTIMVPLSVSYIIVGEELWLNGSGIDKKWKIIIRSILSIVTLLLLWCLFLSYSRGAWLAIVLSVFFMMIIWKSKKLFITVLLSGVILFFPFANTVKTSISTLFNKGYEPTVFRYAAWQIAVNIVKDHPFLGCGLNTYSVVAPGYKDTVPEYETVEKITRYPHNSYLHLAAESGLLGLGAFFWIIFTLFRRSLVNLKKINNRFYNSLSVGLLAGIFGFLIHSFVDTNFYSLQLGVLMWFVMGLIIAVQRAAFKNKD